MEAKVGKRISIMAPHTGDGECWFGGTIEKYVEANNGMWKVSEKAIEIYNQNPRRNTVIYFNPKEEITLINNMENLK